jgi:DNA-binding NarL/FixJ family response regulator
MSRTKPKNGQPVTGPDNPTAIAGRGEAAARPPAEKSIRIVIVEDERLLAETLGAWLASDARFVIEGQASSAQAGWDLCVAKQPNLVLLDVGMPDGDGMTLAKRFKDQLPECRIIILTGRVDPHTAWRASQTGVHGLVDKSTNLNDLRSAICTVAGGGNFTSPSFQKIREEQLAESEAFHKVLSNRELEVLSHVTEGLTDSDIGKLLNISGETVACHRKNIRRKLELHDDRSLIAYGRKWGTFGNAAVAAK